MTLDSELRVAVITADSRPFANQLWYAARPLVKELVIIGSPPSGEIHDSSAHLVLPMVDFRRGLIWRHLKGLHSALNSFSGDLIHVNGELWCLTSQELLLRDERIVVHGAENVWHHGSAAEDFVRHALIRRSLRHISGYVSWNRAGLDYVNERSPKGFPTYSGPAVIPPSCFRRVAWHGYRSDDLIEILLVGTLTHQKGFDIAIRAAHMLRRDHSVRLTVCGVGPLREGLESLATELGVETLFLGTLDPSGLAERMARATLLIQPSRSTPDLVEQFGRSVAEAMTVGLPAFVSSSGELPQLVEFDSEAVFSEDCPQAIVRAIQAALAHHGSGLAELSRRQSESALRWSPERAASEIVRFWQEVSDFTW